MRSLTRGLQVLVLLNQRESAGVAEVTDALRIPRATTFRLLKVLVSAGFIYQNGSDHRYRLTQKVRSLSAGLSDEQRLASIARPCLIEVTEQLSWPVSLGTLSGLDVIVRENTDAESPLAIDRFNIGYRMPLLTTATGLCILAHLGEATRDGLLGALVDRNPGAVRSARAHAAIVRELAAIRQRGFATWDRRRVRTDATSIAVPVIDSDGHVLGAVTIRYGKSAVTLAHAVRVFIPVLRAAARDIARAFSAPPR